MKYQIWDKISNIYTPSGKMFTPAEWIEMYGWINMPGAVPVISTGRINGKFSGELHEMKEMYEGRGCIFTEDMTNEQILEAMEAFDEAKAEEAKRAAEEAAATPSAEERLAAAMEFQNLMNM